MLLLIFLLIAILASTGWAIWALATDGFGGDFLREHLPAWLIKALLRVGDWFDAGETAPPLPPAPVPATPSPGASSGISSIWTARRLTPPGGLMGDAEWSPAAAGINLTPAQAAVIGETAGFEPEDDADLIRHMRQEIAFQGAHADAYRELVDHCLHGVGLDPNSIQGAVAYADVRAESAGDAAIMLQQFLTVYAQVREWTAAGGVLPHDGRWLTGEGAA